MAGDALAADDTLKATTSTGASNGWWYTKLPLLLAVVIGMGVLLAWQLAYDWQLVSPLVLPAPMNVYRAFVDGVVGGIWWRDIGVTLIESMLGLLIGAVSGIILGAILAYTRILREAAYPYIIAIQTFPKVALAPLLMAWLGYGPSPKIIISAMLAFFPVFTNTLAGFREVETSMVELLRSMKANVWQELRYLRLPYALGFILPSLDVALVLALLGAIAAELAGAERGLGQVIMQRTYSGDVAAVYAVLLLLAAMGIAMRTVIKAVTGMLSVNRNNKS